MKRSLRGYERQRKRRKKTSTVELSEDCFSVVLGHLSPWEWLTLLLVSKTWCSWVKGADVWFSYLFKYAGLKERTQNERLLVCNLLQKTCVVHRKRKGSFCKPLGCVLCLSCVRLHTKGFVSKTSARCRFGVSSHELDKNVHVQQRVWTNGWDSKTWYLKRDVSRLAVSLHAGLLHIGNKARKRRVCLLIGALKTYIIREEWNLDTIMRETSLALRSSCRTFLSKDMPNKRKESFFVQSFAADFYRHYKKSRLLQLQAYCQKDPDKWRAAKESVLFSETLEHWLRSKASVALLDKEIVSSCTILLKTFFKQNGFDVSWKALWDAQGTKSCLLKAVQQIRALSPFPVVCSESLKKTREIWFSLKKKQYSYVEEKEALCVLRAAEKLGVKNKFFRGKFNFQEYGAQTVASVREFVLVHLEASFFPAHKLKRTNFCLVKGLYRTVHAFVEKLDISEKAMACLLVSLKKTWTKERRASLLFLKEEQPALFSLSVELGFKPVFLKHFITLEELQEKVDVELWSRFRGYLCPYLKPMSLPQVRLYASAVLALLHKSYPVFKHGGKNVYTLVPLFNKLASKIQKNVCTTSTCQQIFSERCEFQLCGTCCNGKGCFWHTL